MMTRVGRKVFLKSRLSGVSAALNLPLLQMERRRLNQQLMPGASSTYRRSASASSALAQTLSFRYLKEFLRNSRIFFGGLMKLWKMEVQIEDDQYEERVIGDYRRKATGEQREAWPFRLQARRSLYSPLSLKKSTKFFLNLIDLRNLSNRGRLP